MSNISKVVEMFQKTCGIETKLNLNESLSSCVYHFTPLPNLAEIINNNVLECTDIGGLS